MIALDQLEQMWGEGIHYVDENPLGPEAWRELIRLARIGYHAEHTRTFRAGYLERGRLDAEIARKQAARGEEIRTQEKERGHKDLADLYNTGINYSNYIARDIEALNKKPSKGTLT